MDRSADDRTGRPAHDPVMTSLAIETHGLGKRFGARAALESTYPTCTVSPTVGARSCG